MSFAAEVCDFGSAMSNQNRSDSAFFQVHNDTVIYQTDDMVTSLKDVVSARAYLDEVAHQLGCKTDYWKFKQQSCKKLNGHTVCAISVENVGEFFLSSNWVDHVNVIFNRWD
jgi:hypothetical protein